MIALASVALAGVQHGTPPPQGLERAYAPRRVALVVGVDLYEDPALGDLSFAAKDAADLVAVFQDPAVGGYDVVLSLAGEVSQEALWNSFRAMSAGLQRDDTVVVYVASHGTLELGARGTELYLLTSDAWLASAADTGLRLADLAEALEALPARRKVLILDACYAGMGRSVLDERVQQKLEHLRGPIPAPPALQVSAFSAHLYAAAVHQPAIEDPALQNGVYTHYLIEALKGSADLDADGLIEVMEAHQWARDRTLEHTGGTQVPWAETVAVGRDVVWLAGDGKTRRDAEHALLLGLERLPQSAEVTVDGLVRGNGPLQEGKRQIEVQASGKRLLSERIRAVPGERIWLDERVAARRTHLDLALGSALSSDRRWLGGAGAALSARWTPSDPSGARGWLGASGSVLTGPALAPSGPFPVGLLAAFVGFGPSWRHLRLGPELGIGLAWRRPAAEAEGSLALSLGGSGTLSFGRWVWTAEVGSPLFFAERALAASPRATLSAGIRF